MLKYGFVPVKPKAEGSGVEEKTSETKDKEESLETKDDSTERTTPEDTDVAQEQSEPKDNKAAEPTKPKEEPTDPQPTDEHGWLDTKDDGTERTTRLYRELEKKQRAALASIIAYCCVGRVADFYLLDEVRLVDDMRCQVKLYCQISTDLSTFR